VNCIVRAVLDQRKSARTSKMISHVVLVGSFATSEWLFKKVHEALTPLGLNILRPLSDVETVVSDGAISFYLTETSTYIMSPPDSVPVSVSIPSEPSQPGSTSSSAPERPSTNMPHFQGAHVYMVRPIIANIVHWHPGNEGSRSQILLNNDSTRVPDGHNEI